jgi:hypothetical protein
MEGLEQLEEGAAIEAVSRHKMFGEEIVTKYRMILVILAAVVAVLLLVVLFETIQLLK